jgi:hypothetical protein
MSINHLMAYESLKHSGTHHPSSKTEVVDLKDHPPSAILTRGWKITQLETGTGQCKHCGQEYQTVGGCVSKGRKKVASYKARLYQPSPDMKAIDLTVGLIKGDKMKISHFRVLPEEVDAEVNDQTLPPCMTLDTSEESGWTRLRDHAKDAKVAQYILNHEPTIVSFLAD